MGKDTITQPALFPHFLEQARRHPPTQGQRIDLCCVKIGVMIMRAFKTQGKMGLFNVFVDAVLSPTEARPLPLTHAPCW